MMALYRSVQETGRQEEMPVVLTPRNVYYRLARQRSKGYFAFGALSPALLTTYYRMNEAGLCQIFEAALERQQPWDRHPHFIAGIVVLILQALAVPLNVLFHVYVVNSSLYKGVPAIPCHCSRQ